MFTRLLCCVGFRARTTERKLRGYFIVGAATFLCVLGLQGSAAAQSSASFSIVSAALNSGGGQSSSTNFSLNGCLSPSPVAGGTSFSSSFRLQVGCLDIRTLVGCGNGTIDAGEVCDDGNTLDGDCCSSDCQIPGPAGTACGDPSGTECTAPDTCDGIGNCLANDAVAGTAAVIQCNDTIGCTFDQCNGTGGCQYVNGPLGLLCGDGSDTECTRPDTCDGAGTCVANDEPAGTTAPRTCEDTSECTIDECNGVGGCQHPPVAAGTTAATTCADTSECTADECDGAGGCQNPPLGSGTACGDSNSSECDAADACDGVGACVPNYTTAGTPCGDPSATECSDPDACDGAGTCNSNHLPQATACNDGLTCTEADGCVSGICVGAPIQCPDDGNPCTFDRCEEGSAECISSPEPIVQCLAGAGAAAITDRDVNDSGERRDKLNWKWKGGEISNIELGDPSVSTTYDLCIFESEAGAFSIATHMAIPSGASWEVIGKPEDEKGWEYDDRTCPVNGICRIKIRADRRLGDGKGRGKISLKGKGENLPLPPPVVADPANRYLSLEPEVVVQLSNSEGFCWALRFEDGVDKIYRNKVVDERGTFKTKRIVIVR